MRSISATLLAAATHFGGRPSSAAAVQNRRLRWTLLVGTQDGVNWTAQAALGGNVHRARVTAAGSVDTAKIAAPLTLALERWVTWTAQTAEGLASSDVALAAGTADLLRVYYNKAGGLIRFISSSDAGASWGAPASAVTGLGVAAYLAAAKDLLLYQDGTSVKAIEYAGGAWTARATWGTLTMTTCKGLGMAWDATASLYRLVVAADGKIWIGTLNPATWAFSTPLQIAPGGTGTAPSTVNLRGPSVAVVGSMFYVSWVDQFTGTPAWAQPVILSSSDWLHFGDEVAPNLAATTERRVSLVYDSVTRGLFVANETDVIRAKTWLVTDTTQNLSGLTVLSYTLQRDEDGSRLRVRLLNTGTYNLPGSVGTATEPLQLLARVVLSRGYVTSGGAEVVALDPHYLVGASVEIHPDKHVLELEAVDGWGLLDLWHAPEPLTWAGQTARWLLAELCGRVGLSFTDNGTTNLDTTFTSYTLLPTQRLSTAVKHLLEMTGCVGWWSETGVLTAAGLYGYSPATGPTIGTNAEIMGAGYQPTAGVANSFRVMGNAAATALDNVSASMTLGLRLHRALLDYHLDNAGQTEVVGNYLWTRARTAGRRDLVKVPLRPEVELWDLVWLDIAHDLAPVGAQNRWLVGIGEEYDPKRGVYSSTLELEAE